MLILDYLMGLRVIECRKTLDRLNTGKNTGVIFTGFQVCGKDFV